MKKYIYYFTISTINANIDMEKFPIVYESSKEVVFVTCKGTTKKMYKDDCDLFKNLNNEEFKTFKPMPSPIDKIQNRFRWRIIIKGNMTEEANAIINSCLQKVYDANYKNTRVTVDVNPNNMI